MHKRTVALLALCLFAGSAVAAPAPRGSATTGAPGTDIPVDLIDEELREPPPPPEPPYPGSEEGAYAADPSMSGKLHDTEPPPEDSNWQAANTTAPEEKVERPIRVDEDGNYIYDTEVKPTRFKGQPGVDRPVGASKEGEFLYDTKKTKPTITKRPGIEAPVSVTEDGAFHYKTEQSVPTRSASFRIGVLTPPGLKNPDNGLTFAQVYGDAPAPVLFFDYEFPIFKSAVGQLTLKAGSGLMVSSGQGHFRDPARANEIPDEKFTFFMFPNTVTANYRFRFSPKQVLVPYIEGGAGYYTFAEIRDDAKKPKFGAAPVAVAAGGLNFLLDWLDPAAVRQLDNEYGIAHAWVTIEARQTVGLHPELDFTATSGNIGFILEF